MAITHTWGEYKVITEPVYKEIDDPNYRVDTGYYDDKGVWHSVVGGPTYPHKIKVIDYYIDKKGSYIRDVTSSNRNAYPNSGKANGYWYEYKGNDNKAPRIVTGTTSFGSVAKDFSINYTIFDDNNDRVNVTLTCNGKTLDSISSVALGQAQRYNVVLKDYPLGHYTITLRATDENGASSYENFTFSKTNQPPTISGSDTDLGDKASDFNVEYLVQDFDNDEVKVQIKLDDTLVQAPTVTTLGVKRYYKVDLKDLKLGKHKLEIIATDAKGESTTKSYTFTKVNSAPIISGLDEDLGEKNTAFTYTYRVLDNEGDPVKVVEKLNGDVIRSLDNAPIDEDLYITVDVEKIQTLELGFSNVIEIEASDGTAKSYRRVRFTRNNIPPIISDVDKDLGEFTNSFSYSWSATDPEGDKMTAIVYLDDKIIKQRHSIEDNEGQTVEFTGLDMFKIARGKHTLRIVVEDDKGFSSERRVTFTRDFQRLIMKLAGNGIETEQMAKRILVSSVGVYVAKGAVVKYEVCNNSFDESPTWENATNMVMAGKAFNFQNTTKTNAKAGIDIMVTIEKGTAKGLSYINAIGGSYD